MSLPTTDDMRARIDEAFPLGDRRRALKWARTPEGRDAIEAHRAELLGMPRPQPVAPMPPAPSRWANVAGYAATGAWWLLCALVVAAWLYGVDRYPQLWGGA